MGVIDRRQREQQMRRELIIDSARELFESKGFETTTVDEIAAGAELGKGTIYSYFKCKEEIYVAILEQGLETLQERMKLAIKDTPSAREALRNLYRTFIMFHYEHRGLIESIFLQMDQQLIRLRDLVKGLKYRASEWHQLVGDVLQRGIERGEFRTMDLTKTTNIIIGMMVGLIAQEKMGRLDEALENYREALFEMMMEGIQNPKSTS